MGKNELRSLLTAALRNSAAGGKSKRRAAPGNAVPAPVPAPPQMSEAKEPKAPNEPNELASEDRYAALLSRALTTEAQTLVRSVFGSFVYWQRNTDKRVRKYGEKTGKTYHDAIERFIGDLLRAKGDNRSSGRIFHATGATTFDDVPVNYDVFMRMLTGLTALGFVGVAKGGMDTRRATTFWATEKLVDLATQNGVRLQSIRTHFKLFAAAPSLAASG